MCLASVYPGSGFGGFRKQGEGAHCLRVVNPGCIIGHLEDFKLYLFIYLLIYFILLQWAWSEARHQYLKCPLDDSDEKPGGRSSNTHKLRNSWGKGSRQDS